MTNLQDYLQMGGYGIYVWPAYIAVFTFLFFHWFIPWRRLKKFKHDNHQ